jgi:hypothetical protein
LGDLVGAQAGDGWFSATELARMFQTLRVPRDGVSQALNRLKERNLVVRNTGGGSWSLTPEGREHVFELVGGIDVAAVEAEIRSTDGAELQDAPHVVIPPELAPIRWAVGIARLLDRFAFERNVFCMTRFPKDDAEADYPDPVKAVIEASREALHAHGLRLHLASDRAAEDELFGNVAAHMWACKYGVALFETRFGDEFNDNLQIEVGAMLMTGRRVALLKDRETPDMPTDFVGHIYKPADFDDVPAVSSAIHTWVAEDLGLGRCGTCP